MVHTEVMPKPDDNDRDEDSVYHTLGKLSGLLTQTANAMKGPPPELTSWSWHDLPVIAQKWARVIRAAKDFRRAQGVTVASSLAELRAAVDALEDGD
jgi:hypothetical protein